MNDIAIRVENLSTHHPIGQRECYKGLRDIITDVFAAPFRRLHENSQFEIRNVSPAAFCLVVPSRFTFHVLRCHSAIRHSKFAMFFLLPTAFCLLRLCSSVALPTALSSPHASRFTILGAWSSHASRFTFHALRSHSAFRIPHSEFEGTLHLALLNF